MDTKNFNVALMQLHPGDSLRAATDNLEKTKQDAVSLDSEFISAFREQAKYSDMAICVTFLEIYEPAPRDSLVIIDRRGEIVLHYAKVHTCGFDPTEAQLAAGDDFSRRI